jgi:WD40 repeat protein
LSAKLVGHTAGVSAISFNKKGDLASGGFDGVIKIWELSNGTDYKTLFSDRKRILDVRFVLDNQTLISSSLDEKSRLWNVNTGQIVRLIENDYWPASLTSSLDGQIMAFYNNGEVIFQEIATGKEVRKLPHNLEILPPLAFSYSAEHFLTQSEDGDIRLWNLDQMRMEAAFGPTSEDVHIVVVSPNGKYLACAYSWNASIRLWDMASHEQIGIIRSELDAILSVSFSPDGKMLAFVSQDHFRPDTLVEIWSLP